MLDKGRAFVRDLLSVFDKVDGQRSDCPRCNGSGLFYRQRFWPWWNCKSHSNRPCWFCEGIGVMPLYGLQGFFLGRASASFETEQLTNFSVDESPIKLHLCLGKYPGSRCRFGSFKNSDGMQALLYDTSEMPQWLTDAAVELAATKGGVNSAYENGDLKTFSAHQDEEIGATLRVTAPPHPRPPLDPTGLSCHFDPDANLDRVELAGCPTLLGTKYGDTALGRGRDRWVRDRLESGRDFTPFGGASAVPPSLESNDKISDKPSADEEQEQGKGRWRRRNSRTLRQHQMRVKEEKESLQRALWIQGLKPSDADENAGASPPREESRPAWSFSGRWKELSSTWVAEETALARLSRRASSQEGQGQGQTHAQGQGAPNKASTDRALFARLVDNLPPGTDFLNPDKLVEIIPRFGSNR